jgi:hypothetical protein
LRVSTTTLIAELCGDATNDGARTAADALVILRRAVGFDVACPSSVCDVDDDGAVRAGDALRVLRSAVGVETELACAGQGR